MNDSKEYYCNVSLKDFEDFKQELLAHDEQSIYKHISLQKFAYKMTKQLLKHGSDVEGNILTEQEKTYLKMILNQMAKNFITLKAEFDIQEQA